MQGLHVELRLGLEWHEAHGRPRRRLGDRLRIPIVVLLRLHIRPHILGRHQPNLVPVRLRRSSDEMGTTARLHRHDTSRQLGQKRRQTVTRAPSPHHHVAGVVQSHNAAAVLPQVDPENRYRRRPALLSKEATLPRITSGRGGPSLITSYRGHPTPIPLAFRDSL